MRKAMNTMICAMMMLALAGVPDVTLAADVVYRGEQTTLAWDAVTTYEDGSPLSADEPVSYYLWMKNMATGAETKIGETTGTSSAFILPTRGKYRAGVQAVTKAGEAVLDFSEISWSDNAERCAGGQTFVLRNLWPKWPVNFRR